ncbi:hypothetical protein Drorol1_Dr00003723 [Drosera rotundifolia]
MSDAKAMAALIVAPSSSAEPYTSEGYPSSEQLSASSTDAAAAGTNGDMNSSQVDSEQAPSHGVVEGTTVELTHAATSYASTNGDGVDNTAAAVSGENGDISSDGHGTVVEEFSDGVVLSAEEGRLWSIVRANSSDFNAWTALIDETEKVSVDNIVKIRQVYDAFLAEFPLCYGYWKKYADHELRMGALDKVVEVYERAVQGVTYSVDIWLHYCTFAIDTYGDPDTIRRLFERGLEYVGTDYLSHTLWDKYIEYEYTQQEWSRLAMIYTRILESPIQQLDRYYSSFNELAASRILSELMTQDEAAASEGATLTDGGQQVEEESFEQFSGTVSSGLSDQEKLQKYIASREEMYKKAKEFDAKIIGFETAIRRPYFHVRPMVDAELENWHNYLNFIEREGDFSKVVKLYERCLVACANYPEYWIRYILCMEASGSMDLAENALARATQVFVKRQPDIHLFAARVKEYHNDIEGARAAYQLLHSGISPGLLEAIIDHANLERRMGNMEGAFSLYEQAISIEKGKEHSETLPMLFTQYARFVQLVYGNAEKAREILVEALEYAQPSKPLLEVLLYLESVQTLPKRIEYLDSLVEKFILPDPDSSHAASVSEREEVSRIFLEFLGLFADASAIKKATDRHARNFLPHRSSSLSRKRDADDFLASDKAKMAKSYSAVPATAPSAGVIPVGQAPWPAGYAGQPQPWTQPTQAQGQPWNPGYTQQAYGGYYGGNYSQSPIPTSAPQAAAYGSYPPNYQAPAYSQQAYVAPVPVAAAPVPVQQPAATSQQYYGAYY